MSCSISESCRFFSSVLANEVEYVWWAALLSDATVEPCCMIDCHELLGMPSIAIEAMYNPCNLWHARV